MLSCFILHDLLSEALGALIIGLVISALLWGGVFVGAKVVAFPRTHGALSAAVAAVLGIYLLWHVVPMCGAFAARSRVADAEHFILEHAAPLVEAGQQALSQADARELAGFIEEQIPLASSFIPSGISIDPSLGLDAVLAFTGHVRSQLTSYIWAKVAWALGGCVVALALTVMAMEKPRRRRTRAMVDDSGVGYE